MKKDWGSAALFVLVAGLALGLATLLTCGLGGLVTTPMFWLISALAYRDMIGMPNAPTGGYGYGMTAPSQPGVWPPAPTAGQAPPPVYGQQPPQFGQSPTQPPRTSLSGESIDENGNPPAGS